MASHGVTLCPDLWFKPTLCTIIVVYVTVIRNRIDLVFLIGISSSFLMIMELMNMKVRHDETVSHFIGTVNRLEKMYGDPFAINHIFQPKFPGDDVPSKMLMSSVCMSIMAMWANGYSQQDLITLVISNYLVYLTDDLRRTLCAMSWTTVYNYVSCVCHSDPKADELNAKYYHTVLALLGLSKKDYPTYDLVSTVHRIDIPSAIKDRWEDLNFGPVVTDPFKFSELTDCFCSEEYYRLVEEKLS